MLLTHTLPQRLLLMLLTGGTGVCLCFVCSQEMKLQVGRLIEASCALPPLVQLLEAATHCLCSAKHAKTPPWVSPLLLLLDMYQRMAVASKRRADLEQVVVRHSSWSHSISRAAAA